ncbi:MAG: hypothetical protein ABIP51_16180 [Bacteroidia bacterium]
MFLISFYVNGHKPFKQELFWAIGHPFAALKVKNIHNKASIVYNTSNLKQALDNYSNGGKLDAFRHAFFMAAFSQKIKVKKLRKLGIAHEKGNYSQFLKHQNEDGERPDSLSNVMDLNNNEVGLKIGFANKKLSLEELKLEIIKKINSGNLLIMKRTAAGAYVDCKYNVIDPKIYSGKWFVPKCLVSSNE